MTTALIPVSPTAPHFSQQTALDGTTYLLDFDWNEREGAWYFGISTAEGDPIAVGRRVCASWPLLRNVVDARRPVGEIFPTDSGPDGIDPAFADLGTRVTLVYVSP